MSAENARAVHRQERGRRWGGSVEIGGGCDSDGVTIMVDPPSVPHRGRLWSHVASDTSFEELHAFAAAFGIPARGFDRDHYDVPEEHYPRLLEAGALPVSSRELVARLSAAG